MRLALVFILAVAAGPVSAAVESATGDSLVIKNTWTVKAPPERVYAALGQPARWWANGHTWSGDARNLTLDLRAGGCFCEKFATGHIEHLRVVMVREGTLVRLSGALGPLQAEGVSGAMTFEFKPSGTGTQIVHTYVVRGLSAAEATQWGSGVNHMLRGQIQALGRFVDTGTPELKAP